MNYLNEKYGSLPKAAHDHKGVYKNAAPFPSIYFENFFDEKMLGEVLAEFPDDMGKKSDINFNSPNEAKLASVGEGRFGEKTKRFMRYLNSEPFLMFLQELTGIERPLIPDPHFEGAGYHEIKLGGFLKIHADFNRNRATGLDRRLNVLVYLNKDWEEKYGGHFELWNSDMTQCVKKVLPAFNTLAMFSTTSQSWHGLPNPLTCPEGRSRKSLALYYYTNGRPEREIEEGLETHNTLFKDRAGDAVDSAMRQHNTSQKIKEFIKDFTPPVIARMAQKVLK